MTGLSLIINGCKQNNRVSQEKLYMQMYNALFALCSRFFDDEHDIITAINNGMLRVFKNIEQYDSSKSELLTWIYTITRNETLTLIRNKKSLLANRELTAELSDELTDNPFETDDNTRVLVCLRKLPQTTRAVFILFYIEAYSIKATAAALDMKEGTVKWHLSDGRKKLQTIYKTMAPVLKDKQ